MSSRKPLTKGERKIYTFMIEFRQAYGFMPALREIQRHFGLKSPKIVYHWIDKLIEKGYLMKSPIKVVDTSRTLRFVDDVIGLHTIHYEDLTKALESLRVKGKQLPVDLAIDLLTELRIKLTKKIQKKNFHVVLNRGEFQTQQMRQRTNTPAMDK